MAFNNPLKRLITLLSIERKEISSIYFYAVLSGLLQLSLPVGVQSIIGFVMGASMVTSVYVLIIVVVAGVLLVGLMQVNQMKIIEKIQQQIFTRYAFRFAALIPRIDLKKADQYYLPEKMNRFFDTIVLQKGLTKLLLDIPTATIQILLGLVLLSFYHPVFIAFGFMLLLVLYLILRITSRQGLMTSLLESDYKYSVVAWFEEMAGIIRSFKFSYGSHLNLKRTDQNVLGYLNAKTAHFKVLLIQFWTLIVFKVVITAAMLIVGTYLMIDQQLNIGEFIAAEIVIITVIGAVEKLIGNLDSVYDVVTALEKIEGVVEIKTEEHGALKVIGEDGKGLAVDLVNMGFEYSAGKPVFSDVNLALPAGSKVCIMGAEGAGKSTFMQLLNGNYRSFSGTIMINQLPMSSYDPVSIRNAIGCFMNEQGLFKGTVMENISFGREGITPHQIADMAEQLGMRDFLERLPDGFETPIDASGEKLPLSMTRKILLLRAFCNRPSLLLLEEPWLGFDEALKQQLADHILKRTGDTTVVVFSNDEAFSRQCDVIIRLENGTAKLLKNK